MSGIDRVHQERRRREESAAAQIAADDDALSLLRAIADTEPDTGADDYGAGYCLYCGGKKQQGTIDHRPVCLWIRVGKFLARVSA